MKKKILIVVLILLVLFIIVKTREIMILNKIYNNMKQFDNESNRYCSIIKKFNNELEIEKRIYLNGSIEKYVAIDNTVGEYCSIKNFDTNEIYNYNDTQKIIYKDSSKVYSEDYFMGLINIISQVYFGEHLNFSELFKIHYILPTTYDGKTCYKIATSSEVVIIDKDTYLPVYSSIKTENSGSGSINVEYTYKFEVGTVTDEDVAVPDFSDYKIE